METFEIRMQYINRLQACMKFLIHFKGQSISKIANTCGLKPKQVQKMAIGKSGDIKLVWIHKFSTKLNINLNYLFGESLDMFNTKQETEENKN